MKRAEKIGEKMRSKRIDEIEEYVCSQKTVELDQLCALFGISKSTVRRDLDELVERGRIRKTYGGVMADTERKPLVPFQERNITNAESKRAIAARATHLINDGDVIFIDSGTTTLYMLDYFEHHQKVTILTHSVDVIMRALPLENTEVLTLSGVLNRKTMSFTGPTAVDVLRNYNISKAFMATTGFSIESGVTNSSAAETEIKRMAVKRSRQKILLADHSKTGGISLFTYCALDQMNTLVTDKAVPHEYEDYFKYNKGTVLLA